MVTNSEIQRSAFCVTNNAALTADTDIYINDVAYFGGLYDAAINPFMKNPTGVGTKSYRILNIFNESANNILILINGDRDHVLYIPKGTNREFKPDNKLAYFFLVVRSLDFATAAGDLRIEGRRLI